MNADEARQIAARDYGWELPNGAPAPMSATEFDRGFIMLPIMPPPPPQPPGAPPTMTQPGASAVVVDKYTGRVAVLPYLGDEGTAELYRRQCSRRWW